MPFVEVAVNSGLPHRQTFSYAVPDGMTLQPGDAVLVPFGRRQLQGIVMQVVDVPAFADPKPVDARLFDRPVVSPERIELAAWLAGYYLAPLFAAVALMLPPGFERKPLTFYEALVAAEELPSLRLPPRQRAVLSYLVEAGRQEAKAISKALVGAQHAAPLHSESAVTTTLAQLFQRGLIQRSYDLDRPRVQAKTTRYVHLRVGVSETEAAIESLTSQRQGRTAAALSLLLDSGPSLPASELRLRAGAGLPQLRPLVEQGLIDIRNEAVERDPLAGLHYEPQTAPRLTAEQAAAYGPIARALRQAQEKRPDGVSFSVHPEAFEEPALSLSKGRTESKGKTFLLHGVTGSGKTEVYLRALEETVRLGKRAIVLVPEIALTPQTVRRFAERFPGQVAVLHSGLSQGELFDQWHGIRDGRYAVVIGSRSAIFAPQPDLGLIVIDEEHEWTYKQQDQSPRYHAGEAAEKLAGLTGAVLILGSATPDVVSYQRALWGRYQLLELRERVRPVYSGPNLVGVSSSLAMPPVEVVDMRDELKSGNRSIFSRPLQLALFQALEKGEQAILFLNRRGTAGFLQCRDCGFVPQCSACAIALSYHSFAPASATEDQSADLGGMRRAANTSTQPRGASTNRRVERLLCHQCNRARSLLDRCPMCGSARLRPMGLGVERVEEGVQETFPKARTLRWDRDVTQGRHAHEQILASFLKGEADVLIGTQMVAKGLDLPAVTVVGVISADIGLHIPDFRSAERTFQLLTQVAGRAGRAVSSGGGPPPGEVVIQTYTPDNYAIVAAAQHDYAAFFAGEIERRREQAYPPFVRLARLVFSHSNQEHGQREAERMARDLRNDIARRGLPGVEVMGPAPPHVPKWHGRYRWQLTVRSPDPVELLGSLTLPEGWILDIDPASLA